jgi:hypothetical protein
MLEALDHHPLESIPEHGFHRHLQLRRYLDEIGHRAYHAHELGTSLVGEDRADTGAIASRSRSSRARASRSTRARRATSAAPPAIPAAAPQGLVPARSASISASSESAGERTPPADARPESGAASRQLVGLGLGLRQLVAQPLRAPLDLEPALAKLAALALRSRAFRRADLLDPSASKRATIGQAGAARPSWLASSSRRAWPSA